MKPPIAALLLATAAPALAQTAAQPGVVQRIDRLERELRAVQRKVFPGAQAPGYLAPELTAPPPPAAAATGTPATAPIADLTARLGSLEQEMARITGQLEQNDFRLRQFQDQFTRFRTDTDYRLGTLESGAPPPSPATGASVRPSDSAAVRPAAAATVEPASPAADAPPAEAVSTGDPGEDAYLAGYRLWAAKNYAAAEAMLKDVVAKYPKHKRASYAQNLLGRTYLDSGRPAAAAVAFHKNYTTNPRGDRAPDSLYFLGQSLMKLDKPVPAKACEAYDALLRDYGDKIGADLKAKVAKGRADAKCKAGG